MKRSRLRQTRERKTKKELLIIIAVIALLLILLFKYGIPTLINLSLLSEKKKDVQIAKTPHGKSYMAPPQLNQPFIATNTAEIKLTGTANAGETIKLYINDTLTDSKSTDGTGEFHFDSVTLNDGTNTIKALAVKSNSESSYSDPIQIMYLHKSPTLSVDYPPENDTIKGDKSITIHGKTDPGVNVTVNGLWAVVKEDGSYSRSFDLQNGDNTITVIAIDQATNQTRIDRKVTYAP